VFWGRILPYKQVFQGQKEFIGDPIPNRSRYSSLITTRNTALPISIGIDTRFPMLEIRRAVCDRSSSGGAHALNAEAFFTRLVIARLPNRDCHLLSPPANEQGRDKRERVDIPGQPFTDKLESNGHPWTLLVKAYHQL
jgi:hypothetical protein